MIGGIGNPRRDRSDPLCSCVDGLYMCGHCRGINRAQILSRMTPAQIAFEQSRLDSLRDGYDGGSDPGCSCHINPPCASCVSSSTET